MTNKKVFSAISIFAELIEFYSKLFGIELDPKSYDIIYDSVNKIEYIPIRLISKNTENLDAAKLKDAFNEYLHFCNCPFDRSITDKLCIYISELEIESKTTLWAQIVVLDDKFTWDFYNHKLMEDIKI